MAVWRHSIWSSGPTPSTTVHQCNFFSFAAFNCANWVIDDDVSCMQVVCEHSLGIARNTPGSLLGSIRMEV